MLTTHTYAAKVPLVLLLPSPEPSISTAADFHMAMILCRTGRPGLLFDFECLSLSFMGKFLSSGFRFVIEFLSVLVKNL
jgi:hypothetical protein